ncbi:hypothetical protein [Pseudomonas syringae group genomosp. 3]|uniref:hypothetical protein n=1 Tax=Pseudomonas syringae group genomosp. 3 TaxID=251701 RepID=UPI0011C43AEB|nr:hypothetical protein [Pseudomonas syringae group genomosp. 3]
MGKLNKFAVYLLAFSFILVVATACLSLMPGAPLKISLATVCDGSGNCGDSIALLEGGIYAGSESETFSDLLDFLKSHSGIDTACLLSEGGNVDAAVALASFIHHEGINTCIAAKYKLADGSEKAGYCQSSCVWVLLAGKESVLYDNAASLGFHAARKQDHFNNIKGIDFDALLKFAGLIKSVARDRSDQNKLYGLLVWSFDQGASSVTTNCSAQQVQEHYPFFSNLKDTRDIKYQDCGLR